MTVKTIYTCDVCGEESEALMAKPIIQGGLFSASCMCSGVEWQFSLDLPSAPIRISLDGADDVQVKHLCERCRRRIGLALRDCMFPTHAVQDDSAAAGTEKGS